MYNPDNKNTYWFVDSLNMFSNQSVTPVWDDGHYDVIESNMAGYICYRDERLIDGIKSCWRMSPTFLNWQYKGQRYPEPQWGNIGISRDHTIYSFVAFKIAGWSDEQIWDYAKRMPFNLGIEIGMKLTPPLWFWLRLISGKKIGYIWYPMAWCGKLFSRIQNGLLNFFTGGFGKEIPQDQYVYDTNKNPKKVWLSKQYYPTFALKLSAFQLYVLPDSWFKRRIKKQGLHLCPSENFLLQIMYGGKVDKSKVDGYKSMYGSRWADELIPVRTKGNIMEIITNPVHLEANTLDKDLLNFMFNKYNSKI